MLLKMYSVYDSGAKAYLPMFILPEEGQAVRTFMNCCNMADHEFGRNPGDYTLMYLGVFDDKTAEMTIEAPKKIHNGLELVESKIDMPNKDQIQEILQIVKDLDQPGKTT